MTTRTDYAALLGMKGDANEPLRLLAEAGYLWLYLGQLDRSAQAFEALLVLAPNAPAGHVGLAEVKLADGDYGAAARSALAATRSPQIERDVMAWAIVLRGDAAMGQRNAREAAGMWTRARELAPQSSAAEIAGNRLERAKQLELV
jgi:tetratricopeptide (TPR) repeat protein